MTKVETPKIYIHFEMWFFLSVSANLIIWKTFCHLDRANWIKTDLHRGTTPAPAGMKMKTTGHQNRRNRHPAIVSWGLELTPTATPFFKRAYKISHPPGLWAFWDALPSFASSAQSAKIGLSKWIFYVKNHPNLWFFFHWRIIG